MVAKRKSSSSRIPKWTPVVITWIDAVTKYEAQSSDDSHDPIERRTIGFLISKNAKGITVAMEDDRLASSVTETDCQTVTTIPTKMIKKVERLIPYSKHAEAVEQAADDALRLQDLRKDA